MAGRPVSLTEVVSAATRARQAHIHTAIPGRVHSYDAATGLAEVEEMINDFSWNEDGDREFEEPPIHPGIPVVWPRAGGFVLTFPLQKGDPVLVIYSERSLAEWRSTGQKSDPVDASRHNGYAVCIPGCYPDVLPMAAGDQTAREAGAVLGKDGAPEQVRVKTGAIELGVGTLQAVALETKVKAWFDEIKAKFDSHTHTCAAVGSQSGPPGTGAIPITIGDQGLTGSTLVKAKV